MGPLRRDWKVVAGLSIAAVVLALLWVGVEATGLRAEPRAENELAECKGNLNQIGVAFHNYEEIHGHFPGNIVGNDGEPLLSWRVAILPYIGERALYDEFQLDEPWDGPHNKPLLNRTPKPCRCPSRPDLDPTLATYLGFEGPDAFFEKGVKVDYKSISDIPKYTLAVLEAAEGAPWTKPADLPFDPKAPPSLYGAGPNHSNLYNVLLADGTVRRVRATVPPIALEPPLPVTAAKLPWAGPSEPAPGIGLVRRFSRDGAPIDPSELPRSRGKATPSPPWDQRTPA